MGFNNLGFGLGLDATLAGTYTYKSSGVTNSYNPMQTGVFISYGILFIRGYAVYFPNAKISNSSSSTTGTATKFGV